MIRETWRRLRQRFHICFPKDGPYAAGETGFCPTCAKRFTSSESPYYGGPVWDEIFTD